MAKQPQRRSNSPTRPTPKRSLAPSGASSRQSPGRKSFSILFREGEPFIFGRRNFIFMGVGLLLVISGLIAMAGGAMPDPETWDPDLIYSFRRITLAPILMVVGFVVVAVGIFIKPEGGASPIADDAPAT